MKLFKEELLIELKGCEILVIMSPKKEDLFVKNIDYCNVIICIFLLNHFFMHSEVFIDITEKIKDW